GDLRVGAAHPVEHRDGHRPAQFRGLLVVERAPPHGDTVETEAGVAFFDSRGRGNGRCFGHQSPPCQKWIRSTSDVAVVVFTPTGGGGGSAGMDTRPWMARVNAASGPTPVASLSFQARWPALPTERHRAESTAVSRSSCAQCSN